MQLRYTPNVQHAPTKLTEFVSIFLKIQQLLILVLLPPCLCTPAYRLCSLPASTKPKLNLKNRIQRGTRQSRRRRVILPEASWGSLRSPIIQAHLPLRASPTWLSIWSMAGVDNRAAWKKQSTLGSQKEELPFSLRWGEVSFWLRCSDAPRNPWSYSCGNLL